MFARMNDWSSSASAARKRCWFERQRWLRVAAMGRLGARLGAQIRKYLVGIVAAAAAVALVLFGQGAFVDLELLEYWAYDRLFDLRGQRPPTPQIVVVSID